MACSMWYRNAWHISYMSGNGKRRLRKTKATSKEQADIFLDKVLEREAIQHHINSDRVEYGPFPSKICGVYCLLDENEEVIYVGQSVDVFRRIAQHKNGMGDREPPKEFAFWRVTFCKPEELDQLEYEAIELYRPPLNKRTPSILTGNALRRSIRQKDRCIRQTYKQQEAA